MSPSIHHPPELLLKAQGIRVALFDVDGVLTDGGLYFSPAGEELKRFNTLDGFGFKLLQQVGIVAAIISGRDCEALRSRMQALGIRHVHYGVQDKCVAAQTVLQTLGLQWEQAAVMADDWPDLPLMLRCGLRGAPPNAHAEVLALADFVSQRSGGHGAVRDFCDLLLVASGKYAALLNEAAR